MLNIDRRLVVLGSLAHEQHLPSALDGAAQLALIARREVGVFSGEQSPLVGDELLQEVDVPIVQLVDGEVDFWFGPRRAGQLAVGVLATFVFVFLVRHVEKDFVYLISRCKVRRRRKGLYFFFSTFSVCCFLFREVI